MPPKSKAAAAAAEPVAVEDIRPSPRPPKVACARSGCPRLCTGRADRRLPAPLHHAAVRIWPLPTSPSPDPACLCTGRADRLPSRIWPSPPPASPDPGSTPPDPASPPSDSALFLYMSPCRSPPPAGAEAAWDPRDGYSAASQRRCGAWRLGGRRRRGCGGGGCRRRSGCGGGEEGGDGGGVCVVALPCSSPSMEIPTAAIHRLQSFICEAGSAPSPSPAAAPAPPFPSVAAFDSDASLELRCGCCGTAGGLLCGAQSAVCVYCGCPRLEEGGGVAFRDSAAYRWLLGSLRLDGSLLQYKNKPPWRYY